MRVIRALCCAAALAAVIVPNVGADEYTKTTHLTFSGPVQIPGATLPAGTYTFKLADPDSGRRAIQVWDKEAARLIATLLTIPDDRMEATSEPVVLFGERPSGEPQAVKAWFYPNERTGMEFIYPKDQAMKIARDARSAVLSYQAEAGSDVAEMRGAKVGRVDASGQVVGADADTDSATATTASSDRPEPASSTVQSSADAAATTAPARSSAQAQTSPEPQPQIHNDPATTSTDARATTAAQPSANRTESGRVVAQADADAGIAANDNAAQQSARVSDPTPGAVGTSGQAGQDPAATRGNELPRTASPLPALQLLSGVALFGAFATRQLRKRLAGNV